ncbi:MAG TPA: hypothetical protein VIG08_17345 [Gemmatimonadales bacterium]|jgi:hypothetical protein
MKRLVLVAALAVAASPLLAQDNPFKLPKSKVPAIQISYAYAGDMQGTAEKAISKDRLVSHETTTAKFFGKTTNTDSWTMFTPEWNYTADLSKKTGMKRPNVLPYMEKAYDDLDGTSKKRLHQNMQDMAQMMTRAFGSQTLWSGEKTGGTKTYAGETCEEHTFGAFSVCSMKDAPVVPLHMQGSLLCVDFEETATSVRRGEPPASAFEPPAGIDFTSDTTMTNPDSLAHGFVNYLASQQLADSIAKAKADMAKQSTASDTSSTTGSEQKELTPEEKAQQRQACEALKNFDLGKTMANAGKSIVNEAVHEVVEEKKAEARQDAKNKIKKLIKKPF